MFNFKISDTFSKALPADPILENNRRQVENSAFSYVTPRIPSKPSIVHVSPVMAQTLGFDKEMIHSDEFLKVFSGATTMPDTKPYAMCYGGHQFGHWAGQLGDGRAINLAEVETAFSQRWTLQLKGAGATPYSRTADGLAVLRSSVREHLCSEAMYHLGVPTTRSLSLMLSGDQVMRDMLYDGNRAYEKGAIVCRVAESFIRFGNFQIFASRDDAPNLKLLTDYTIKNFFTHIDLKSPDAYAQFFDSVVSKTMEMVLEWQRVGFVHGVMNTDNMSILGLTIDYGPYGWLEGFDRAWTPNTTDKVNKRYQFGNQPSMGLWNLYQLANSLAMLVKDVKPLEASLERFKMEYAYGYSRVLGLKIGLKMQANEDLILIKNLEDNLGMVETDMTIFYRLLAKVKLDDKPSEAFEKMSFAFYDIDSLQETEIQKWETWFGAYLRRLNLEDTSDADRKTLMDKFNPKYVLRNYMAQLAIDEADKGNYELIEELYKLLQKPYDEQPESEKWFAKRPEWARNKVGCSMLSCSS